MSTIKRIARDISNPVLAFFFILGFIVLALAVSFVGFTFGYWLITLILAGFFNFVLPFSWWYSLGAWLITLILGAFVLPSRLTFSNSY